MPPSKRAPAGRRAAGERRERDRAELAAIYDNAPVLICVLDADRRILRVNKAFSDLIGVPERELAGGSTCGVLGCCDAGDDPRGFGSASTRPDCTLLEAIDDTAKTGTPHRDIECRTALRTRHGLEDHVFRGWAVRIAAGARTEVLLCLRDMADRVRAEKALAESERRFALALAASIEAVWEWPDLDVPRFWWSPRFYALIGYRPDELEPTMDTFMGLVHPDDRQRMRYEKAERIASADPFQSEYRLRTRSGDYRWFAARGLTSPPRDGKPRSMIGTIRDITGRHRTEEALRQSEYLHKTVVEHSPDVIARFDRNLRYQYVNPAVSAVTGIPADRFVGRTNRDLGLGDDLATNWDRALRAVFDTGRTQAIEFEFPGCDGIRCFSSLLIPERSVDGSVASVLSIARDVTGLKQAQQALAIEEHRHRLMLDTLQEGILALGGDGTIVYANASIERMLGRDRRALRGTSFVDMVAPAAGGDPSTLLSRWLETPGARNECAFVRADGSLLDTEVGVGRLVGTPGGTATIILSVLDITERRRVAKDLHDSQDKLRNLARHLLSAREEERRKMAQEIHDELGQVLTGLSMDLRWLARRLEQSPPAVREKVREATDLADRTIRMVQRISAELRPRMLDDLGLGPALEWLAGDFSRRLGIACSSEVSIASSRIGGNAATTVFRIVQESLTNVARHARASRVTIRLREEEERLELEVVDDGIGISEGAAAGPRSFGLIGLRERVQELGGEFAIDGRPGAGTRVSVTIPFPEGRNLA